MFIFLAFVAGLILGFFVAAALYVSSEAEARAEATPGARPLYKEVGPQEYGGS